MEKILFIVTMLFFAGSVSYAQDAGIILSDEAGWHKIGEVKASFKTESESITVVGEDKFRSIRLRVTEAPISIDKVTIYYESGDMQEIDLRSVLKPGAETGDFRLKNPADELKKVTFTYRSEPNADDDKAHVELYGLK